MAHRTQITLSERQYARLRQEAERTGASLAELVRRAIDEKYGSELTLEEKLRILEETRGVMGEAARDPDWWQRRRARLWPDG